MSGPSGAVDRDFGHTMGSGQVAGTFSTARDSEHAADPSSACEAGRRLLENPPSPCLKIHIPSMPS